MIRFLEKLFGDRYERRMKKPMQMITNPISEECWNLDLTFVEFMIPRLELFKREASKIIKYDFSIVDNILVGFKLYAAKFDWNAEDYKKNIKVVEESMKVFSEHWMEFWW